MVPLCAHMLCIFPDLSWIVLCCAALCCTRYCGPCCAVLCPAGPADMGFSFGLHVQQDFDLPAMMASPDMQQIYGTVLEVGQDMVNACASCNSC